MDSRLKDIFDELIVYLEQRSLYLYDYSEWRDGYKFRVRFGDTVIATIYCLHEYDLLAAFISELKRLH